MADRPARQRSIGAAAVSYRAAMVVGAMHELSGQRLPSHWSNAFIQSALTDLRALVGFLLADADDVVVVNGRPRAMSVRAADVKPSWYLPTGEKWVPRTMRRRRALYAFYDPVGAHLAHIAVKSRRLPGPWPIKEATAVVFQDLGLLLGELQERSPTEARRFDNCGDPLSTSLSAARQLGLHPYPTPAAERSVARARRLLRTQLQWPLT